MTILKKQANNCERNERKEQDADDRPDDDYDRMPRMLMDDDDDGDDDDDEEPLSASKLRQLSTSRCSSEPVSDERDPKQI